MLHWKNIRNGSTLDIALMALQMSIADRNKQSTYRLKGFQEVEDVSDLFLICKPTTYFIFFTDWRYLYRQGFSCKRGKILLINKDMKNLLHKSIVSSYAIIMTETMMFSIDIL